jgi:predicted phage-related endonuclease
MNRQQWLEDRRSYIGGSDVAAILGLSKWRSALDVYYEKTNEAPPNPEVTDVRRKAGIRMQRPIVDDYLENEGVRLVAYEPPTVRHPDLPLAMNLDAVVANEFADEWNLDAKNVFWRVADEWGEVDSDSIPDDAFYQAHLYNFLSPPIRHKTDFAVLVGGEWPVRRYTVARDDEFFAMLVDKLVEFWNHVEKRTPPDPDFAHPLTVQLMQRLYPEVDPGKEIVLHERYAELAERYYALGKIESIANKKRQLLKGELLFALGDAAKATIPDSPWELVRSHVSPRRCQKCGFSKSEEGSTKFQINLPKASKGTVPALEAAAIKLIEGGVE